MSLFGEGYRYDDGVPDSMCCEHGEPLSVECDECNAEAEFENAADECEERTVVCPFDTIEWGVIPQSEEGLPDVEDL